jgi:hypothetical protein
MRRCILPAIALACLGTPALAADLDEPIYHERDVYIERPPVIVEKRIIEHHHHYVPAPVYSAPPAYYVPRVYDTEVYYDRPHRARRPHYYFSHGRYWRNPDRRYWR